MKVLITGGAGFLGLHLAHFLSKKGFVVTLVDINEIDADEYPKNAKFVLADVRDGTRMTTLLKGKDVVIHAAAALPLWKRQEIFDVNIEGTRNVLSASLKNGVKHVVFISSTAVYGIQGKHPTEEDDPLAGVGPYGESKIQAEKLCMEKARFRQKSCVKNIEERGFLLPSFVQKLLSVRIAWEFLRSSLTGFEMGKESRLSGKERTGISFLTFQTWLRQYI
ncbi:NAD(P)-dependent oxidoreductase [Candidatus Roizmanbacteria bacterium]|nr:NAD(P)-dependent oxidoreductase [Candidatus Roizmanbacteria bacterium]